MRLSRSGINGYISTRGIIVFNASQTYPGLEQLSPSQTLHLKSQDLMTESPDETKSLSFFSFTSRVVAEGWRDISHTLAETPSFLFTIFLSASSPRTVSGGFVEVMLSAAVERINASDGSLCHQETIDDYATLVNEKQGLYSTDLICSYETIDTDLSLPIAVNEYFVESSIGCSRRDSFLARQASFFRVNAGTYLL
ncbi:hypothetical protein GGR50DRAFT_56176 [Xylaria sp. CBS 124048]|nr:hypothetical protein GGR50DRAFT_56176 [Xylaria sp. CBS 124048]